MGAVDVLPAEDAIYSSSANLNADKVRLEDNTKMSASDMHSVQINEQWEC